MTLRESLLYAGRRYSLVIVVILVSVAAALAATLLSVPRYKATSSVFFSLQRAASGSDLFQGGNFAQQQAVSYAELVQTPTVLDPVIKQLALGATAETLSGDVVATTTPNTSIVNIDVTDASSQRSADIANATAQQLGVVVRQIVPRDATTKPAIEVTTIKQAVPPSSPSSPKMTTNLLAGLLVGLVLGVGLDLLNTRMRSPAGRATAPRHAVGPTTEGGPQPPLSQGVPEPDAGRGSQATAEPT